MNDRIRISPIRVVDSDGEMLGELETDKARELARDQGLDLVEVSPDARPPVCRIMDYGKAQYEKQKKARNAAKSHAIQVKQIRLRAKTGHTGRLPLPYASMLLLSVFRPAAVHRDKIREFLGER